MTRGKKALIATGIVVVLGAIGYANFAFRRTTATDVNVEKVSKHDLEAIVSASGKIRAKKTVNVSAETVGKVVNLAVAEGERVRKGQLLLEIDPRNLETMVQNREASLASAKSQLDQTRAQIANSQVALQQAKDTLRRQEDMWRAGLIPRETYERAQNDVKMRETDLIVSEQSVRTQEQRIKVEEANLTSAQYDLNKVRMESPIDGLVTKRNVEEGETAMIGTMNNAGTVLLTIADMSVIETEIEVDETDVPHVQVGQMAKIEIDAFPDRTLPRTSHGSRKQSDCRDGSSRIHPGPGDELQGRRADRRRGSGRPAGLHVHRHDHDGNPQECARRADSGHDCPRARRGRSRQDRADRSAGPGQRAEAVRRHPPSSSPARRRKEIEGVFVCGHGTRDVRASQDRHRGREVLRGPRRPEGRRRGHHGARSPPFARSRKATP